MYAAAPDSTATQNSLPPPDVAGTEEESTPPPQLRKPPERFELVSNRALAEALIEQTPSNTEVIWLGEGKDQYVGLFINDFSGNHTTNALILHDNQQHPDWPGLVHSLRTKLPAHGWSTLSISVPHFNMNAPIPERQPTELQADTPIDIAEEQSPAPQEKEEATSNPMEAATAAIEKREMEQNSQANAPPANSIEYTRDQVPSITQQRISESLTTLQNRNPSPTVIISIGLTTGWVSNYLKSAASTDISGVVFINPITQNLLDGFSIAKDISQIKLPILDITSSNEPVMYAQERIQSANSSHHPSFEQRTIPGSYLNLSQSAHQITMNIRGWAKRLQQPNI